MASGTIIFLGCLVLFALTSWQTSAAKRKSIPSGSQQCRDRNFYGQCKHHSPEDLGDKLCASLPCAEENERGLFDWHESGPPVNGTLCGRNKTDFKICINKKCTAVKKEEVPHYDGTLTKKRCGKRTPKA